MHTAHLCWPSFTHITCGLWSWPAGQHSIKCCVSAVLPCFQYSAQHWWLSGIWCGMVLLLPGPCCTGHRFHVSCRMRCWHSGEVALGPCTLAPLGPLPGTLYGLRGIICANGHADTCPGPHGQASSGRPNVWHPACASQDMDLQACASLHTGQFTTCTALNVELVGSPVHTCKCWIPERTHLDCTLRAQAFGGLLQLAWLWGIC